MMMPKTPLDPLAMLEYKAEWYGREIIKIDRFYPSTQLCSGCGYKNEFVKGLKGLKFREWTCPECGEVHDRDLNAARNILKEELKSIEPTERGGDIKFTAHHTVLVEMCLHLKPTAFRRWVVHDKALGIPKTDGVVDWKAVRKLLESEGII